MNEPRNTSDAGVAASAATERLPDALALTRALFGRFVRHVPMWMVVQDSGRDTVTFVGASRDPALHYGSRRTHQLILGELVVRPHFVIESDQFRGYGLTSLLTSGAHLDEWVAGGHIVCDPIGRFQVHGRAP